MKSILQILVLFGFFLTAQLPIYAQDKPGQWTLVDCAGQPDARHETAFVALENKFYLIGGRESQKIDRFDPETGAWTKMQATTPLIHHFQPVVWGDKIYMAGAMTGHYPKEPPMTCIQIYDPETETWTECANMNIGRHGSQAVVYNNKVYIAAGSPRKGGGRTDTIEYFQF